MTNSDYENVLNAWGVEFSAEDPDCLIEGSPERTAARTVCRDAEGARWILEQIEEADWPHKQKIAEFLLALESSGLKRIHPWRPTEDGVLGTHQNNSRWMLRPYMDGVELNRETYLHDAWRLNAMADFLIHLRRHSFNLKTPRFSIADYAQDRMDVWRGRYPKLAHRLNRSFNRLKETFFPVHDQLSVAFCHGDYHPLNMVWAEEEMASVIDWEFCGTKPELYDVALLLGCIGFETPDYLIQDPSIRLMDRLRCAGFGEEKSWEALLGLMATIRFGWMSEWIRRQEEESMELELSYIEILVDQAEYIQQRWDSSIP